MTNTKAPRPNKFITFDQLTFDLVQEAAKTTGLTFSHIVDQFMRAHVEELIEFNSWMKRQGQGFDGFARGVHALEQYGPHSLITEMKRIDPTYQPQSERLLAEVSAERLNGDELADLRAMLDEWKAAKGAKQ